MGQYLAAVRAKERKRSGAALEMQQLKENMQGRRQEADREQRRYVRTRQLGTLAQVRTYLSTLYSVRR